MSYADRIFKDNCREILTHGVWDTDQNVRPHWEDGTPAHTVKPAPGVPHPHHPPNVLQDLHRRAAVDMAAEVQQYPGPPGPYLGQLGR